MMRTMGRPTAVPGRELAGCCGLIATLTLSWLVCVSAIRGEGQAKGSQLSSLDRSTIEQMLKETNETVRKQYFDPNFQGADLDASYRKAEQLIAAATSVHQGYEAVNDFLAVLQDSHTHFIPPKQPFEVEQGWRMQMIGDQCLVTHVKKSSDAAAKGLKPGDRILVVDGAKPSRSDWLNLEYQLNVLSQRSSLHLVVAEAGLQLKMMVVESVVKQLPAQYDLTTNDIWRIQEHNQMAWHRFEARNTEVENVAVLKLPVFAPKNQAAIDSFFHKAEKYPAVIIDLRGNPGGAEDVLLETTSKLFDHEIKIGDTVGRNKTKPLVAKGSGSHAYSGKVIVLIDSQSASSSEIFARVVQLEKRGTVVGDSSAGAVRRVERFNFVHGGGWGAGNLFADGVAVTVADLKMTDGGSLEKVGVTPDEVVLPTPEELAAGADPQLARALQLAGAPLSAEKAGKLFPVGEE
jgi:carboxyl-terminal processing protease